jgi:hypothetical protein
MLALADEKINDPMVLQEDRLPAFRYPDRYPRKQIRKPAEADFA